MTLVAEWDDRLEACDLRRVSANALPQRIFGVVALVAVGLACAWAICANVGSARTEDTAAPRADALVAPRGDMLHDFGAGFATTGGRQLALAGPISASSFSAAEFEARFSAGRPPGTYFGTDSLRAGIQSPTEPLSVREAQRARHDRAVARILARRAAAVRWLENQRATAAPADTASRQPSFLERLFGKPKPSIFERLFGSSPAGAKLAYAGPTVDEASITAGLYDRHTAVYDISKHVVYLPDGRVLEAHSGYGSDLDRPSSATIRDRGVTPPDIYDLRLRGRLFHGVQALRLLPEDEAKVFGRQGLLAHTYMLGPNGQSNGCVSFKDYKAFLQAFQDHEISRLAVVARLD
jgi:hypothetical protein